jgi:Ca2+-transporting ATPase
METSGLCHTDIHAARGEALLAGVTLGVVVWGHATDRPWQTMAFLALGATQLAVAIGSRARPGTRNNPMLLVAVAGALTLQVAGVYLPPLRHLLGTAPLSIVELVVIGALATLGYAAVRLDRKVHP